MKVRKLFMNTDGNDFDRAEFEHDRISNHNKVGIIPDSFGICAICSHFIYRKTVLENDEWGCNSNNNMLFIRVIPNKTDRMKECTDYYPRNQMDLYEMYQIAHPIEIKKDMGFKLVNEDEDEDDNKE